MAAPKKKRAEDEMVDLELGERGEAEGSSDVDEEGMDDCEESSEEVVDEEIQVEFEARTAEDSDFHGIKKLLQQLFLKANINLSQLTDTMIGQNYVGSVIKQVPPSEEEDDDDDMDDDSGQDVYGVISCINITDKQHLECMQQVKAMLLSKCEQCSAAQKQQLAEILGGEHQVGLLLSERFINIPAQISLPSFDNLWKELSRAVKKKMNYTFSHYVMISKTYRLPVVAKKKKQAEAGTLMFINSEEEYFFDEAALTFDYSVKHERDTLVGGMWDDDAEEYEPLRTVIIVHTDSIQKIMARMRETLAMPQP